MFGPGRYWIVFEEKIILKTFEIIPDSFPGLFS